MNQVISAACIQDKAQWWVSLSGAVIIHWCLWWWWPFIGRHFILMESQGCLNNMMYFIFVMCSKYSYTISDILSCHRHDFSSVMSADYTPFFNLRPSRLPWIWSVQWIMNRKFYFRQMTCWDATLYTKLILKTYPPP